MATTRVYVVVPKVSEDGKPVPRRLVRATHPSNALRHVAADQLQVAVASQEDLISCLRAGVVVESIAHEQTEIVG